MPITINNSWLKTILFHLLFWCVMYAIYLTPYLYEERSGSPANAMSLYDRLLAVGLYLFTVMVTSYFSCFRVLVLLYQRNKIMIGIIEWVLGIYLFSLLYRIITIYGLEPLLNRVTFKKESIIEILLDPITLFKYYTIKIVTGAFPFVIFYLLTERQKTEKLKTEIATSQLVALKAQIHPHFLFNTLNNIYSLAQIQSTSTAVAVEKLSHLLDYLLYECNSNTVALEKEIQFLENYLALNQIRFGDRLKIEKKITIDNHYQIAPLLLLPIIENMFKHGLEKNIGETVFKIHLSAHHNTLSLTTINSAETNENKDHGIGLQNLREQLDLLYPGKHKLKIDQQQHSFEVNMQVPLL